MFLEHGEVFADRFALIPFLLTPGLNVFYIGVFIFNNYRQALGILTEDSAALRVLQEQLSVTPPIIEHWFEEEKEYMRGVRSEPPDLDQKITYVKALDTLRIAMYEVFLFFM